jgi:hypothetical protein
MYLILFKEGTSNVVRIALDLFIQLVTILSISRFTSLQKIIANRNYQPLIIDYR